MNKDICICVGVYVSACVCVCMYKICIFILALYCCVMNHLKSTAI